MPAKRNFKLAEMHRRSPGLLRDHITAMLRATGGNFRACGRILGVDRMTIWQWVWKLKIDWKAIRNAPDTKKLRRTSSLYRFRTDLERPRNPDGTYKKVEKTLTNKDI